MGWKRWIAGTGIALAIVALTPVAAGAAILSPFLADDLALDHTVRAVALDWRDFGRTVAQARLEYELDHQGIGLQVGDEDCTLTEEAGTREVACAWFTTVSVPGQSLFALEGVAEHVSVPFASRAIITAEGELR